MTTHAYTNTASMTDDATFRAWVSEMHNGFLAAGLVQTADTGQLDPATVTKPGTTNAIAGYLCYRFNDSLQGTAPIFMKIELGTTNTVTNAAVWVTVGTGTNGAGTITGQSTARTSTHVIGTLQTDSRPTYMCHTEGAFWMVWRASAATGSSMAAFGVFRTCDGNGASTNLGFVLAAKNNGSNQFTISTVRTAATAATTATYMIGGLGFLPGPALNTQLQNGNTRAFPAFAYAPDMVPITGAVIVLPNEHAMAATFSVACVGSTPHTYIALRLGFADLPTIGLAGIWE